MNVKHHVYLPTVTRGHAHRPVFCRRCPNSPAVLLTVLTRVSVAMTHCGAVLLTVLSIVDVALTHGEAVLLTVLTQGKLRSPSLTTVDIHGQSC